MKSHIFIISLLAILNLALIAPLVLGGLISRRLGSPKETNSLEESFPGLNGSYDFEAINLKHLRNHLKLVKNYKEVSIPAWQIANFKVGEEMTSFLLNKLWLNDIDTERTYFVADDPKNNAIIVRQYD